MSCEIVHSVRRFTAVNLGPIIMCNLYIYLLYVIVGISTDDPGQRTFNTAPALRAAPHGSRRTRSLYIIIIYYCYMSRIAAHSPAQGGPGWASSNWFSPEHTHTHTLSLAPCSARDANSFQEDERDARRASVLSAAALVTICFQNLPEPSRRRWRRRWPRLCRRDRHQSRPTPATDTAIIIYYILSCIIITYEPRHRHRYHHDVVWSTSR